MGSVEHDERRHDSQQAKREEIGDAYREQAIASIVDDICSGHYVRVGEKRCYAAHFIEDYGVEAVISNVELAMILTSRGDELTEHLKYGREQLGNVVRDWCKTASGQEAVDERINDLNEADQQRHGGHDDE